MGCGGSKPGLKRPEADVPPPPPPPGCASPSAPSSPPPPAPGAGGEGEEAAPNDDLAVAVRALLVTGSPDAKQLPELYDLAEELGAGAYGAVRKVRHKSSGELRALKTICKALAQNQERGVKKIKMEIDVMRPLDHPNVVKLHETFEDRWNVHLVLELCAGETLHEALLRKGPLAEGEAASVFRQILEAIRYLHKAGVCHRDVKAENLLFFSPEQEPLEANTLKLGDFGLACRIPEGGAPMTEKVGSPLYVAPQVLEGRYGEQCDLWSCGVLLYVMLAARVPFFARDGADLQRIVWQGTYSLDDEPWDKVSELCKNLVCGLLERDPRLRLSAEQALRHPWVNCLTAGLSRVVVEEVPMASGRRSFWQRAPAMFACCSTPPDLH